MSYQTVNPYTGEPVKSYPFATDQEIDATIEKAHEAFLGWRAVATSDRSKILTRAAELLRADKRAFAEVLTLEMGKIIAEAEAEVELSAEILDYFADHGAGFLEDEPLGVIYAIEPWNFPYYQVIPVSAPQILAGNTIINLFAPVSATDHIMAHPLVQGAGGRPPRPGHGARPAQHPEGGRQPRRRGDGLGSSASAGSWPPAAGRRGSSGSGRPMRCATPGRG